MKAHWIVARYIKSMTKIAIIPLEIQAAYWEMWHKVYRK